MRRSLGDNHNATVVVVYLVLAHAAFAKATQEYILWLDADDVLLSEDQAKFIDLKKTLIECRLCHHAVQLGFDEYGNLVFS